MLDTVFFWVQFLLRAKKNHLAKNLHFWSTQKNTQKATGQRAPGFDAQSSCSQLCCQPSWRTPKQLCTGSVCGCSMRVNLSHRKASASAHNSAALLVKDSAPQALGSLSSTRSSPQHSTSGPSSKPSLCTTKAQPAEAGASTEEGAADPSVAIIQWTGGPSYCCSHRSDLPSFQELIPTRTDMPMQTSCGAKNPSEKMASLSTCYP